MNHFDRVYHKYTDWEEMQFNMWGTVNDRAAMLDLAVKFTSNHVLYGSYMLRVVNEWHVSCENALTDNTINQKAWIGHAACALAINCPEDITRKAWGYLTNEQQKLANMQAEWAIRKWKESYSKSKQLHSDMGEQSILRWDS